jgi:arsenite methyltransferase
MKGLINKVLIKGVIYMGCCNNPKKTVREQYGRIAESGLSCCGGATCAPEIIGEKLGYSQEELNKVPEGSNLGLGCGNPTAIASLKEGEVVLDLGAGAGFDCFLAAEKVGKTGKVIGVDMTPEMLKKAKNNAETSGFENVEFRLGEIENLPIADSYVDVIISNCVINLSPDHERVFREAYRALKPGGRMYVSDMVLTGELPASAKNSVEMYVGCIAGAKLKAKYLQSIGNAGFKNIIIQKEIEIPWETVESFGINSNDIKEALKHVVSITISAEK